MHENLLYALSTSQNILLFGFGFYCPKLQIAINMDRKRYKNFVGTLFQLKISFRREKSDSLSTHVLQKYSSVVRIDCAMYAFALRIHTQAVFYFHGVVLLFFSYTRNSSVQFHFPYDSEQWNQSLIWIYRGAEMWETRDCIEQELRLVFGCLGFQLLWKWFADLLIRENLWTPHFLQFIIFFFENIGRFQNVPIYLYFRPKSGIHRVHTMSSRRQHQ